ncbi:MAG: hypothetical protein BJ554DRAFT_8116 [Olpidium bornovanus]|uniref:Uncharacterized protein n=1 Tax=Olpidium bornovanus TaxID=278681 RepID=A0A8H8DIU7_9FUNG|nr:MAG: hypothetical protein BJ554DRAFT_8116 [Olpidium bornovanus]
MIPLTQTLRHQNATAWSNTDAPPTMAQFAAEAPQEKLTVADWNADFERSFGRDLDFGIGGGVGFDVGGGAVTSTPQIPGAADDASDGGAEPLVVADTFTATAAEITGGFESDFSRMKLSDVEVGFATEGASRDRGGTPFAGEADNGDSERSEKADEDSAETTA